MTKAECILSAMKRFKFGPADSFMIGDAVGDIRQGKRAGVGTVATCWGFQSKEILVQEKPDFIADSPRALLPIFGAEHRP